MHIYEGFKFKLVRGNSHFEMKPIPSCGPLMTYYYTTTYLPIPFVMLSPAMVRTRHGLSCAWDAPCFLEEYKPSE